MQVLQSDFEESVKAAWIGVNYHLPGVLGNDIRKTNLPNIRVQYRHLVLSEELNVLENNAASRLLTAVPSLSPLPQGATLETLAAAARNQPLSPSQRKRIPPQPSRPAGGSPRLAAAAPDAEGALRQRVTSTETSPVARRAAGLRGAGRRVEEAGADRAANCATRRRRITATTRRARSRSSCGCGRRSPRCRRRPRRLRRRRAGEAAVKIF